MKEYECRYTLQELEELEAVGEKYWNISDTDTNRRIIEYSSLIQKILERHNHND